MTSRKLFTTPPFGYEQVEGTKTLRPVPEQIEALKKARYYLENGSSLREVANWVTKVTGRHLSHMGLKYIMKRNLFEADISLDDGISEEQSTRLDTGKDGGYE